MSWLSRLSDLASERERAGLRRQLRPRGEADELIDVAGNDYLGLSRHPDVIAAASGALKGYGLGATASRLVRGSTDVHTELEEALAALLGCDAALVYSSGYLANLATVRAVANTAGPANTGCLLASDAHNHASLVDGCRLAVRDGATTVVYSHVDTGALESALSAAAAAAVGTAAAVGGVAAGGALAGGAMERGAMAGGAMERGAMAGGAVVLTESVFSVHGDLAPLPALHAIAHHHGAILVVDDAHGLGVLGPDGGGAVRAAGLCGQSDVVVTATLSKALGAAGGVVAGPREFIRHLVETSRTFIFDTGLPPSIAAGALVAVSLVASPVGEVLRAELARRATAAFGRFGRVGLSARQPAAGVISVAAPGPDEAVAWAAACRGRGVAVGCFRPPSTPDGLSRLRLTINAAVPAEDFDRALDTIVATRPMGGPVS